MTEEQKLNRPWLVAVWPGMGQVGISAGYYLMAKLGMHLLAELPAQELFEVEHVEIKGGLIRTGRLPRSRLFAWSDPQGKHDLIVFLGEAQPPQGKHAFCRRFIESARELGVERIFTFAAMATAMDPGQDARVFGAATDLESLAELKKLDLGILEDGHISGLNGVLLGAAAECEMRGACLLGEMPHIFTQFPYPKASLAILEVFTKITGIEIDLTELTEQVREMEHKLGELLVQMKQAFEQQQGPAEEEWVQQGPAEEERIPAEDTLNIEQLFARARQDRSVAYELKRELDRLEVYHEYEDRFLDLFKKTE